MNECAATDQTTLQTKITKNSERRCKHEAASVSLSAASSRRSLTASGGPETVARRRPPTANSRPGSARCGWPLWSSQYLDHDASLGILKII